MAQHEDPPSWLEDPHLSLDRLTPGQRYTLVLVAIVIILMFKIGLPRLGSSTTPLGPSTSVPCATARLPSAGPVVCSVP